MFPEHLRLDPVCRVLAAGWGGFEDEATGGDVLAVGFADIDPHSAVVDAFDVVIADQPTRDRLDGHFTRCPSGLGTGATSSCSGSTPGDDRRLDLHVRSVTTPGETR